MPVTVPVLKQAEMVPAAPPTTPPVRFMVLVTAPVLPQRITVELLLLTLPAIPPVQ